jgi:dihydroneopterin aldolase
MAWVRDPSKTTFTWHPRRLKRATDYSDVVVLVDSNYEGDSSDMPEDAWQAICDAVYAEYGGETIPLAGRSHVHVRLTNLPE